MSMRPASQRAELRSRAFQLLALVVTHPDAERFADIADGSLQRALTDTLRALSVRGATIAAPPAAFAEYEADYITLFVTGPRGRALLPLNSGEYEALRHGRSRPEQMLEYLRCYRHFGVQLNGDAQANELPDHLSCQLEFMAWLAHLEAAARDTALELGYRRAQRDFITRLLAPLVREMGDRLARVDDAAPFFVDVLHQLAMFVGATGSEFDDLDESDDSIASSRGSEPTAEVALWD